MPPRQSRLALPSAWVLALLSLPLLLLAPRAAARAAYALSPTVPGVSAIVIDAQTGDVLSQIDADAPRYAASLTKLMTLYLAFQALRDHRITLQSVVPVSAHAASMEPVKLGLRPGWYFTVGQAIDGMVTLSANDAASALGEYLGGSESRFAQMMTLRAHAMGMWHTTFVNASGLPGAGQITTARDIAILARRLILDFPQYYHYFSLHS
ncbi:MAG: D-alanyl-D-alanine carboxypeptidase family protein, partial [Acetobacteraceae bacterium]